VSSSMARCIQTEFGEDIEYSDVLCDEDVELVSITTNYSLPSLYSDSF